MKCKKTQAYFTLNGKQAEMVWTDWETEDNLCYDEIMHYYRQYAKIHKVELEWVKYGKKYIFKKPQGERADPKSASVFAEGKSEKGDGEVRNPKCATNLSIPATIGTGDSPRNPGSFRNGELVGKKNLNKWKKVLDKASENVKPFEL